MELPGLDRFLAHDESLRAACAQIEQKADFHAAANAEIALPEANCLLRVRVPDARLPQFVKLAASRGLAVVADPQTTPADLPAALAAAGFASQGRTVLAVLDPAALVDPPGAALRFTSVGPSELPRFTEYAAQGAPSDAARRLWFFRLRNLLFSAYLTQDERGAPGSFALFHAGGMTRFLGPYPGGAHTDFPLGCRIVKRAWERAREKGAELLYAFARAEEAGALRALGFTIHERVWLETFAR
jgi:hypothetical protein